MDVCADGLRLCHDAVEMIAAFHLNERVALAELDAQAAADRPDPAACARLAAALPAQLALHLTDEETDMFPLLRRRAASEDDLDETLARLSREHADLAAAAAAMPAMLALLAQQGAPQDAREDARSAVRAFGAARRRHIMFENAVVLPLARARLTEADRAILAGRMAARRGICLLPRAPAADLAPAHAPDRADA